MEQEEASGAAGFNGLTKQIAVVLSILVLASHLCGAVWDPVFFGDLTIGRWIVNHYRLPDTEIWTTVGQGVPFSSPNWLFQLLLGLCERLFGFNTLLGLKLVFVFLYLAFANCVFQRLSGSAIVSFVLTLMIAFGTLSLVSFSSELAAYPLFLLLLIELELIWTGKPHSSMIRLGVVSLLFANLHAASFVGCVFGSILLVRKSSVERRTVAKTALILAGAAVINPYFGAHIVNGLQGALAEFNANLVLQISPATIYRYDASILLLLVILLLVLVAQERRSLPMNEILFVGLLIVPGLAVSYILPYSILGTAFMFASVYSRPTEVNAPINGIRTGFETLGAFFSRWPAAGSLFVLFAFAVVEIASFIKQPMNMALLPYYLLPKRFERQIAAVPHQFGSFVVYRAAGADGAPLALAYADARVFSVNRKAGFDLLALYSQHGSWEAAIEHLRAHEIVCPAYAPVCAYIARRKDWRETTPAAAANFAPNSSFGWRRFERAAG